MEDKARKVGQHLEYYAKEFEMDSVGDGHHGRLSNRCDVVTSASLDEHLYSTTGPELDRYQNHL